MTFRPLQEDVREALPEHPEIEFALVLARVIDSVSQDPEQLRGAVYELARKKLQELSHDPAEKARLMRALEIAIAGVEAHSRGALVEKQPSPALPAYLAPSARYRSTVPQAVGAGQSRERSVEPVLGRWIAHGFPRPAWPPAVILRFGLMLLFFATAIGLMVVRRHDPDQVPSRAIAQLSPSAPKPPQSASAAQPAQPVRDTDAQPKRQLPSAYGVYAESGGKLYELEMLQGRAPDPRVAISAAITKPSQTTLPDGQPRFIVFRREPANDAVDAIDVRVVARVKQATSFDASGKPVTSNENVWVIRNISTPYRAAPLQENPQMYEIEPRETGKALSPGRYVLVLKGLAYDFTVDGAVTDKRHCLERLSAANGVFYSECPTP